MFESFLALVSTTLGIAAGGHAALAIYYVPRYAPPTSPSWP